MVQQVQQTINCSGSEIYQELNMRVVLSVLIQNLRVWQESDSLLWVPKTDICPVIFERIFQMETLPPD